MCGYLFLYSVRMNMNDQLKMMVMMFVITLVRMLCVNLTEHKSFNIRKLCCVFIPWRVGAVEFLFENLN